MNTNRAVDRYICKALNDNSIVSSTNIPSYEDIFGTNTDKMKIIAEIKQSLVH